MTLDRAIEVHEGQKPDGRCVSVNDKREAHQLGYEALKRVKWHKEQHERGYYELLPGETEE
ncbi:unnamed protein product [marine sediment metagenome]|uniref:Uncharacterized protein n=1 Tax=marine sediment metagenome TaxID=412755 RepID=X1R0K5_9ZZZZ